MSAKGKEYKLAIRIAGVIDKTFTGSLATANAALKLNVKNIDSAFTTLDKGYNNIMKVGTTAFKAVAGAGTVATVAVAAATAAAINAGREFETAFAGVKKTVDETAEGYAELRQDILDMSEAIPSTAVEIAKVMEVAGQLGIANDNLTEFTKTMINLGVSTNMSAEEAATALAKFANITGMDPTNYENLGSVIVALGNNFATTEEDIVAMATRLAATGELTGLTEAQIMALATAMSSVGIASESGGSTMSKILKKMQTAVELNSDALQDYASVANMTGEQFAATFKEDAVVALSAFIDGLNDTERNGKSAIVILNDMGLKEVRLSNTLLSLSNASGVMTDAINMANEAWDENTALAIEAGKRYETTDSKIQLLKNSFFNLGVAAYDDLQEPFRNVIDSLTEGVQNFTDYLSGPTGLSSWITNFSTKIPTVIRNVKTFGNTASKFLSPLLDIGKWFLKNPNALATVFVAMGSALATYKVASTLTHIVAGLVAMASNPITLGIAGLTATIGLLAGAAYNAKANFDDLVDAKINKAFGDIALSLEDIKDIASYIVDNGTLDSLRSAMTAFEELDGIQASIDEAVTTLDKMNFKVSIGMQLTEEEQEEYKLAIDSFVTECQDYVLQKNYAINLAIGVLKGDDLNSGVHSNFIGQINQFYADYYQEFSDLGTQLNQAVNDAFLDGLFEIPEMEKIAELQAQMANMQNMLADADFEAGMVSLSKEYDLTSLDSDSFKNLQSEITTQLEAATEQYKTARDEALVQGVLMKNSGAFTEAEYNAYVDEIWKDYLDRVSQKQSEAASFLMGAIDNSMISDMMANVNELTGEALADYMDPDKISSWYNTPGTMWHQMIESVPTGDIEATAAAVEKLLSSMQGTIDMLYESEEYYVSRGLDVPEWLSAALGTVDDLLTLTDKESLLYAAFGQAIDNDSFYSGIVEMLKTSALEYGYDAGYYIPEGIANGMDANFNVVTQRIQQMTNAATLQTLQQMGNDLKFKYPFGGNDPLGLLKGGHADGGIFTQPHIAAFAEKGPEAAIPLDGSQNAISLWERTGQLLGMGSVLDDLEIGGSRTSNIEYKPTLIFNGGTPTQSDLESAMATSQERFEAMMNQYLKDHARVAF